MTVINPIGNLWNIILNHYLTQNHYKKQNALFTKAEINFLKTLGEIVTNPSVAIFGKVRIAGIITPQKTTNRAPSIQTKTIRIHEWLIVKHYNHQ
jgi:hypothetical protein